MQTTTPPQKKRIFSGVQPSGNLTIGNYIGALRNFPTLQDEYDCYYCVADMHSITIRQQPAQLRRRSLEVAALYMACGLDPQKTIIYLQSHVAAHAQLAWVLNCYSYIGELSRMTQFKDKSRKNEDNLNAGLLTYPVLMAADILLFQSDLVPVGEDQRQHLELCRDVAQRFNNVYGPTFVVPEGYIPKQGARIKSLQDPEAKMSKSDPNPDAFIAILDEPDAIRRKLKRAVTDSQTKICYDPQTKPGVSNLLDIYCAMADRSMDQALADLDGRGYGDLKAAVTDATIAALAPVQAQFKALMADKAYMAQVLKDGAQRAEHTARKTLAKVYRKVGFVAP